MQQPQAVAVTSREHSSYRPRYRFGAFALDPATRELRRDGELLSLSPKVFDGIAYLLENRDRAVGHDELTAAVWGRADVTDVQLRQLMRKIRRAVSDDGEHQAVIRTIAHFGFHWTVETAVEDATLPLSRSGPEESASVAEAVETAPISEAFEAPPVLPAPPRTASGWRTAMYATAILALVVLGIGAAAWNRTHGSPGAADGTAFAKSAGATGVLPTEIDASNDANTTWMRLGLMDFIASRLRKASVPVVASSDVVALSRGDASASELAAKVRHATGADDIVTSSATHQSNRWRVRLALQRADGREHEAEAYSPDALIAAREASDRLLTLLGKNPPAPPRDETAPSTMELAQRVESALLIDDFKTARGLIESAPESVRELPEMQLDLARIDSSLDKDDAARERLVKLLSKVSAQDDPVLRARALANLGWLDTAADDFESSLREYTEAIELLGKADEPRYLGSAYLGRAVAYSLGRQFDAAKSDYAQARIMFTLVNDSMQLARVDNNEASLDSDYGQIEALALFERAADTMERFGAVDKLITPVCNQILSHLALLQPAQALAVYQRMRLKVAHAGSREALNYLDYLGAASLSFNGRLTEARALLSSVSDNAAPKEEANLRALIGALQAKLALGDGKTEEAARRAAGVVDELASPQRLKGSQAEAWLTLTRALRATGNTAEAQLQTQRFAKLAKGETPPSIALRARLAEAEQHWSVGQRSIALQAYADAMQTAEQAGKPYDIRTVTASYGAALLDAGDLQNASAIIGRVGRWASSDFESALLQVQLYHTLGQPDAWRSALETARALAGERPIPVSMQASPVVASLAQAQR